MKSSKILRILLLCNILEALHKVVRTADGRTHAFVHVDGDLRYLMDGVSMEMQEFIKEEDTSAISFTDLIEENLNAYASPIAFHPPMLNFHFHPVGMPHMEHVIVQNLSPDTSIHMLSISGNTLHTHCSFFQEKVIPPGGNTSFDVVLLAREEGPVEDTLFIHTSLGSFKFQVSAIGIPNPYRLRPFVGVRMPLNSSYSPIIYMHNPHSSTLQLTEMYSSGGDLHLELPDGESEASKTLWEIPPYETKPVVKANFIARIEKNHTAFIRILTNSSTQDYLLLPVEVDVTSAPGIYSPTEVLDFGVLRTQDEPKVLTLSLLNSGQKHIHIANVIATPVNEAVDVKFMPTKVPPDTVFSTQVASITFTPSRAIHPKQCCGKIVVKSKNNQYKLQIPYQVRLIRGFLDYNKSCTRFYVGLQRNISVRELNVTNNFNVTIIIYRITLADEAKRHFSVNMTEHVILTSGKSSLVAFLTFQPTVQNLQLTTYLRLHTNVSHFDIPLLCFTGRLKVFLPHVVNETFIDFGTLGMGDKRTVVFAVINENPVDVNLKFWGSNASKSYVELVGVDKGNASTLAWRQNFSAMARSLILKPQHYAIFRIGITAPNYEGIFNGQAFVETQYEKINVPFSLRTAKGALKVDDIYFENSFPGKISTQSLYVHSTFSHPMTITGISTVPEDSRIVFDLLRHGSPVLHPNAKNMVGKIHFDHRKYCKSKCYSGLPTTTSMGHQWLLGMALLPDVSDTDKELFQILCRRWQSVIDLEEKTTNITLRIDTTEVRGYLLRTHTTLHWPRLLSKYSLKFPTTQIGNRTVKDFTLENPSSLPLLVQVVPLSLYPNPANIISVLKEKFYGDINLSNIASDPEIFTLEELEENNPNPENHIPAYRKSLEEFFGIQSHKKSIAMLLTPGMRVRIQVGFTPKDDSYKSSLILIRNNLTVMDALLVHGQGGHGQIKFGNISPGSDSVLMFELTEKLLKDCDSTKSTKYSTPNFTVRRAFTARNTGALPVYVKGFDINGKPCEGYGFRILNCQGFELKPNASRKVDIAYTPDFSLTRVERTLNIRTSQGASGKTLQFIVVATVPRHMLAFCSHALPRPYWEPYIYYSFIGLSCTLILAVVVCAFMDSRHILHTTFFPFITVGIHTGKLEKESVFDLKAISASTVDSNSYVKHNGYQSDVKKKKENDNVHENNNSNNSSKNTSKRRESLNTKDCDEHISENKHSRKRNSKSRQVHENYFLEPDIIEIKKSQPRNSWTRFLKPPFSFHACSNINNKPSVATQTNPDACEMNSIKSLKELDIIRDQNINCFIENNTRTKSKGKIERKYNDAKNCGKKNDALREEETSSTTTETSTTESDISEKDHRLPDVCVTTKSQKVRYSKNKCRDSSTDSDARNLSKSVNAVTDAEGFELSTKSRGHKKIKVDPNKVFGGDILRPSTLELPYKPKPVTDPKTDAPFDEDSVKANVNAALKTKGGTVDAISDRIQNFSHQNFNCLWPTTSPENFQPSSSGSLSKHAPSYSAALSRDIVTKNKDKNNATTPCNRVYVDNAKPNSSFRQKRSQISQPSTRNSKPSTTFSPNAWNTTSGTNFYSPQVQDDDLSGSKLKHWMFQSNTEYHCSSTEPSNNFKDENAFTADNRSTFNECETLSNKNSVWSCNPLTVMQAIQAERRLHLGDCSKYFTVYNDWPSFDMYPVGQNLWDSNYNSGAGLWNTSDVNSSITAHPVSSTANVWNSSGSSVWQSDSLSWSTPSCDTCSFSESNCIDNSSIKIERSTSSEIQDPSIGEFNPFHTPSALWMSQLNDAKENFPISAESDAWSFSLFSDPSHAVITENTLNEAGENNKDGKLKAT